MQRWMSAHQRHRDRVADIYISMESHYLSGIAQCDAWLKAHKTGYAVPLKFRRHSASWYCHRAGLDDALIRLVESGVTYDPSCGPPDGHAIPAHALNDAREARQHWLELQPEKRDEALFTRYEVDAQKMQYTKQLLALREAEQQHWRQMRHALQLRERFEEACSKKRSEGTQGRDKQHTSLKGVVRGVVWLNRKPYAILQDEEQRMAASRRRVWRRVGNTVVWLQMLQSKAGLDIPFRTEVDA